MTIDKCIFGAKELPFLGYTVNADSIKPQPERVEPILQFVKPKTIKQLRRFLGLLNFYRRNVPQDSHAQYLLCEYLKGKKKSDNSEIAQTTDTTQAFNDCKTKLANAALLAHPHPNAQLVLHTDASSYAVVGGVAVSSCTRTCGQLLMSSFDMTQFRLLCAHHTTPLLGLVTCPKTFRILKGEKEVVVSIDRLKPAYALKEADNAATRVSSPADARVP
ncbi:hypothetical protein JTE90_024399 [Oedothorax gibbosus]|uniref:Reverse transcriptase/retrotransposon-derived protein RNase H-like domain-containing protein n=1 Tax=Oedothorax gibbosus TaxID=931172 RepID=A0AAV6TT01_9ARAC|nr:hypothetical protein JTE90_024399 [Oedothorax gibbosus]